MQQALNFAGIYGMTQALSIALNVDFNNILENDSIERIKTMAEHLTDDPDVEGRKRGLLGEFMGPIPGDIMFEINTRALINSDTSRMREMLLGDYDYEDPVNMRNAKRYRLSTEWGRWQNKILPEVSNGHGYESLFRHIFAAYPRDWTRENNKRLYKWLGLRKPNQYKRKSTKKDKDMRKMYQLINDLQKGNL